MISVGQVSKMSRVASGGAALGAGAALHFRKDVMPALSTVAAKVPRGNVVETPDTVGERTPNAANVHRMSSR